MATLGLGSAVVLNVIFWLALLVSLPVYGFQSGYLFGRSAGLLLMGFIAGLVILLTRGMSGRRISWRRSVGGSPSSIRKPFPGSSVNGGPDRGDVRDRRLLDKGRFPCCRQLAL